jgi:hypothetical protein
MKGRGGGQSPDWSFTTNHWAMDRNCSSVIDEPNFGQKPIPLRKAGQVLAKSLDLVGNKNQPRFAKISKAKKQKR